MILPRVFLFLATSTLIVYILVVGRTILIPFVISLFVWYLINALADLYFALYPLRASIRYPLAIVSLLLVAWIPIELTTATVPLVIEAAPAYQDNFESLVQRVAETVGARRLPSLNSILNSFSLQGVLTDLAAAIAAFTGNLMLILVYVTFLLLEQTTFRKKIDSLFVKGESQERVVKIIDSIYIRIRAYVWVKTLGSFLTGLLSYIIFRIVGLDFAGFWAVAIFFLNYIPNIGSILGVLFPTTLAVVQYDTFTPAIVVSTGTGLVQLIIGNVFEPKMMGRSLNLSPFAIIFSLVFWGAIWGIVGALLSVPLMVVIMIVLAEFQDTRALAVILSQNGSIENV
jgi:AI-2 transport protein TqsA